MFEAISAALGELGTIWATGFLVFAAVYGFMYAIFGLKITVSGASRLNIETVKSAKKRKKGTDRRKEIQDQIRKQEDQLRKDSKASLEVLIERAGMTTSPFKLIAIFAAIGAGLVGLLVMKGIPLMFASAIWPIITFVLPKKFVNFKIGRLQKRFIAHFPDALDVLVRGVRTGLPINEGMRLVAREMPEPVSTEFRLLTDATSVGVTLEDALGRMFNRMPLPEVNFFNIVLAIQKQTGGNLSEALGNLSNTLRERKKLKQKIKALSSEAKASAMIIGSLPFLLATVLFAIAPDYLGLLFSTTMGHMMVAGGLFWMSCGVFMMYTMIDIEI